MKRKNKSSSQTRVSVSAPQNAITHSSMLLSVLDKCIVALSPRVGGTDRAYVVYSPGLFLMLNSIPGLKIRTVTYTLSSSTEKRELFLKKSPAEDVQFLLLDHESSYSALSFYLSYLEVLIDNIPKILDIPSVSFATLSEPFIWLCDIPSNNFVRYAKYITAYPMARFLRNAVPAVPDGFPYHRRLLFTGVLKNVVRNRLVSYDKKNARLFWGILQGVKRGAAEVPESFIMQSLEKHMVALTTPSLFHESMKVDSWGDQADKIDYLRDFEKKTFNIFNSFVFDESKLSRPYEPSWNASLQYSRISGGQRQSVLDELADILDWDVYDRPQVLLSDVSGDWDTTQMSRAALAGVRENIVGWYHEPKGSFVFHGFPINEPVKQLWRRLESKAFEESVLSCKVVPIVEPLKVRNITTGEGIYYFLAKPYQIALWDHLGQFPQFILISEPFTAEHLYDILQAEYALRKKLPVPIDFNDWVSGDYSGATDGVDGQFTKSSYLTSIEPSVKGNPNLLSYFKLCEKVIGDHDLIYIVPSECPWLSKASALGATIMGIPDPRDKEKFLRYKIIVRQRTGQLMGSPLSFPFLCTINVVAYWIALERYCTHLNRGKLVKIKLRDLPVRVNGDDICFRTNSLFYQFWLESIKDVGFTLSLGKNYVHPRIVTINSVMYEYTFLNGGSRSDFMRSQHTFNIIPYLNPGLLTGQSKLTGRDWTRKLPLWDVYAIVMEGASDKLRIHQRFIHYNLPLIKEYTVDGKFNLFMPKWLGGLGFPIFPEVFQMIEFTPFQRRFATFLLSRIQEELALGFYPMKYLSALVTEQEDNIVTSYVRKQDSPMGLFPPGPFPPGVELYRKIQISARPLTTVEYDFAPNLKIRHPSRSLLREFKRVFESIDVNRPDVTLRQISNEDILLFSEMRIGVLPTRTYVPFTEDIRDFIVSN